MPCTLIAQIDFGLTGGLNLSSGVGEEPSGTHSILRYNLGVKSNISLSNTFLIASSLQYSLEGWGTENYAFPNNPQGTLTEKGYINLHYIDFQILAAHFLTKNLLVEAGAEYGRLLRIKNSVTNHFNQDFYEKDNVSLVVGVGYTLSEDLQLNLMYAHGLTYLYQREAIDSNGEFTTQKDIQTRTFQLTLSYFFL